MEPVARVFVETNGACSGSTVRSVHVYCLCSSTHPLKTCKCVLCLKTCFGQLEVLVFIRGEGSGDIGSSTVVTI